MATFNLNFKKPSKQVPNWLLIGKFSWLELFLKNISEMFSYKALSQQEFAGLRGVSWN